MQIKEDVLKVLSDAVTEGNSVTLTGQLDRKLYLEVNKVLEAAGGKWNKKAKAHIFDDNAEDLMEQIILTGEIVRSQDFGYFPTPKNIVDLLLEKAELNHDGLVILEPSAGQGAIAKEASKYGEVCCVELLDKNIEALKKLKLGPTYTIIQGNFLNLFPVRQFDRVIMNPPFAKQDDIKHVTHAFNQLKPGGILVSIMSAGVVFRDNKLTKDFRDLVNSNNGEIERLPEGTFKESGTMVNTVIVKMRKE